LGRGERRKIILAENNFLITGKEQVMHYDHKTILIPKTKQKTASENT
jgi:hypothetical protein